MIKAFLKSKKIKGTPKNNKKKNTEKKVFSFRPSILVYGLYSPKNSHIFK